MGPSEILVSGGVAAILAGLVGGGLKAFGVELPHLASVQRQLLLLVAGTGLIALGLFYSPPSGTDPANQVDANPFAGDAPSNTLDLDIAALNKSAAEAGGSGREPETDGKPLTNKNDDAAEEPAPARLGGPTFSPPTLDNRTIDQCIRQEEFVAQNLQCEKQAQRLVAAAFCKRQGYTGVAAWDGTFTPANQNSYVLVRERLADGQVRQEFVADDRGGATFSTITCQ